MSIEGTVLVMKNSEQAWAHRALVAAEKIHNEDPSAEYFKVFIDMRSDRKVRKACKEYIVGMESEAEMVYLSCCHLLSDETIHYRLHTTPEGDVAKVEK
jgi:hypothetical protein